MSIIKYQVAEASDRYWQMRRMYSNLIKAIQEQDTATMSHMVNEWEKIEEQEEQSRKNFINSLKSS